MTKRQFYPMIENGSKWDRLTEKPLTAQECNSFLEGKKGTFKLSQAK